MSLLVGWWMVIGLELLGFWCFLVSAGFASKLMGGLGLLVGLGGGFWFGWLLV